MNELFNIGMTASERKRDKKKYLFKELTSKGITENVQGLSRGQIRFQIRQALRKNTNSAPSQFAGQPSRRQRRFTAKLNGDLFTPTYNFN
ncbi:hypothetical protein [Paenibacillus chitinolyticus]|uniref:hypothetical protein n=1 Tax=Paenibacillus chitinolyticus TaxID=79263 RepID=UPI003D002305